jgi:hypothetical protein
MTIYYIPQPFLPDLFFDAADLVYQPYWHYRKAYRNKALFDDQNRIPGLRVFPTADEAQAIDKTAGVVRLEIKDDPTFFTSTETSSPADLDEALLGALPCVPSWSRGLSQTNIAKLLRVLDQRCHPMDVLVTLYALHIDGLRNDAALFVTNPAAIQTIDSPLYDPDRTQRCADLQPAAFEMPATWEQLRAAFVPYKKNLRCQGSRCVHRWTSHDGQLYVKKGRTPEATAEEAFALQLARALGANVPEGRLFSWAGRLALMMRSLSGDDLDAHYARNDLDSFGIFRAEREMARQAAFARVLDYYDFGSGNMKYWKGQTSLYDLSGALRRTWEGFPCAYEPKNYGDASLTPFEKAGLAMTMQTRLPLVRDAVVAFANTLSTFDLTRLPSFPASEYAVSTLMDEVYAVLAFAVESNVSWWRSRCEQLDKTRAQQAPDRPRACVIRLPATASPWMRG